MTTQMDCLPAIFSWWYDTLGRQGTTPQRLREIEAKIDGNADFRAYCEMSHDDY